MTSKKSSRKHSGSGEVLRMGVAAAAGAAAAYGAPALWKLLPAKMTSAVAGQVGTVADKVKGSAVDGASRVAAQARQNASQAATASTSVAKRAASDSARAARKTTTAARKTTGAARKTAKGGSGSKSRARKPA